MLRMRNPETILWLERAGLSRVLCQSLIMQRAMEKEFGYQQENTSFSFCCDVTESVVGLWNCHVWYAGFLTVNACLCCLLLSVIWHGFFSTVCILTRSRIVRGPVVGSAHEGSQQGRWLLAWSRFGQCCCESRDKLSCCGAARANTTPVQLGNLTYDRTNDISKGNLGTTDVDGALWIAVVCVGVRPVYVRCAASVTYSNPCLWCLETRMRKPTNSGMEIVSRMRWPRPTAGWYYAQSGIRGVVNLLGKVPDKQSVDTKTARLQQWSQIFWQRLEWRGFVWLRAMLIHQGGHAGFFECCLQGGCKG